MAPKLSIIIPTYQEEHYIERTLKNLATLDIPHEVVITDGGSTDATLGIVRQYTDKVVVWDRPKMGRRQLIGEARNLGATVATGEYFCFIDADVIIPEPTEFFTELLTAFEKNPKLVGVTAPLVPLSENHSLLDHIASAPLNFFYIVVNNIFHSGNASGEFQLMRASAFRHLGGYNPKLVTGEDNDMFQRLGRMGRTLSYRKLSVQHSLRRPHTLGWPKLYWMWMRAGFMVMILNKQAYEEWEVVR
ncbi:MAG: glycosyltransferase [Patescibacteria group bacterium]